jgi:hypothetical protein
MAAKLLVATASFAADIKGQEVFVHAGERFQASHPVVKAHGQFFEPEESVGVKQAPRSRPARRATRKRS